MSVPKDRLYRLIDALPDGAMEEAAKYLESLLDQKKKEQKEKLRHVLEAAPYDDEPLTEEDIKAFKEAEEDIEKGNTIPWDVVKREFGL